MTPLGKARGLLWAAALTGLLTNHAPAADPATTLAGPARCRFAVPEGWDASQMRWTGDCRDGMAQGLGTLRALRGNQVQQVFYGRLTDGQPVLGAI